MHVAGPRDPASGDCLYLRVNRIHIRPKPGPGLSVDRVAFNVHEGALSVDWCRRAWPETTRRRGSKPANEYFIAAIRVEDLNDIDALRIALTPTAENPAHVDVLGELDSRGDFLDETLSLLRKRAFWVIPPPGESGQRGRCPDPDPTA